MYRNILFDIGGVVVDYSPKDFLVDKFYNERTEKRLYDAVFGSPEWKMLDNGVITWEQAYEIFMKRGQNRGMAFEMRTVLDEWTDMLTTRNATVALMRTFKKRGLDLYYLSNMPKEVYAFLQNRKFWPLFEGGIFSYEVGISKPDVEIFHLVLKKYNLDPGETIFIDDMRENASAAFEAGITGIPFTNVKNLCKMLVTYGVEI